MRLLKRTPKDDIQLISVVDESPPPYAILSRTWDHEHGVTHRELVAGTGKGKTGFAKIGFCVGRAAADNVEHCWVDTCCIDKSDPQEVRTAIDSMLGWYQRAKKCYVYPSDVEVAEEVSDAQAFRIAWAQAFQASRWFTRGWTLQELLAPAILDFFSRDGRRLGSRISLEQEICEVTRILVGALRGQRLAEFSVEERMSWAARRLTIVKEDKVYCLLGIFEVFLPLIYREGEAYADSRLGANHIGGKVGVRRNRCETYQVRFLVYRREMNTHDMQYLRSFLSYETSLSADEKTRSDSSSSSYDREDTDVQRYKG